MARSDEKALEPLAERLTGGRIAWHDGAIAQRCAVPGETKPGRRERARADRPDACGSDAEGTIVVERHWDAAQQLADLAVRVADLSRENARLAACHAEVSRERDRLAAELTAGRGLERRIAEIEAALRRWEQERRRGAEQLVDLLASEREALRARVESLEGQLAAVLGGSDLAAPAGRAYPEFGELVAAIDATITRLGSPGGVDRGDDGSANGR